MLVTSSFSAAHAEPSRISAGITDQVTVALPRTHVALSREILASASALSPASRFEHLQLVLLPSDARRAALAALVEAQHKPGSAQFRRWITPGQYGATYGVEPADISKISAWLKRSGFTVNFVYPNDSLIDFSGSTAAVEAAFHTTEMSFRSGTSDGFANTTDISVPAAFRGVVAGVLGLSSLRPQPLHTPVLTGRFDAARHRFVLDARSGGRSNAVGLYGNSIRGLVPADLQTIYGVNPLLAAGYTGRGVKIAVVEDGDMTPSDWTNFVSTFKLGSYGGTFAIENPAAATGANNCLDPTVSTYGESDETVLDAEWATAMAPGAAIRVASCADYTPNGHLLTSNFFGGVFIAATNEINAASSRPDIISASYGYGEYFTDAASKTAIDAMWEQADAEGISVFVSTGDSGSNPSFNGYMIDGSEGNTTVDANSFGSSPHVTAVGGTDFSDIYDKTTSKFWKASASSEIAATAEGYVPEIPWNQSCGNSVIAGDLGYSSVVDFCKAELKNDPQGYYLTAEAGSGGPSSVDAKPWWQSIVYGAANDTSRDLPDVALFAGSYGQTTWAIFCTAEYPCSVPFSSYGTDFVGGTSLATPMFAGIQALVDQVQHQVSGVTDQGNAAPWLYQFAAVEYGSPTKPISGNLAACDAALGNKVATPCVFHNVARGSIVTNCFFPNPATDQGWTTLGCAPYGTFDLTQNEVGLTTTVKTGTPASLTKANAAFNTNRGWSFASGLGSVNATKLAEAWALFASPTN